MGVEIVQYQMDLFTFRISAQQQALYKIHKVLFLQTTCHFHMPPFPSRFYCQKYVPCTVPFIFVVFFTTLSDTHTQWFPRLRQQLLTFLIHTYHRMFLPIAKRIQLQKIIHTPSVFRRDLPYAPHLLEPRLTFVFFRISLTLSRFRLPNPSR